MSNADALLDYLEYRESPFFLQEGDYAKYPGYAHVFRQARGFGLRGVYTLREKAGPEPGGPLVPLVYVCETESEQNADELNRKTWNQNVVPFLLVATPKDVRLYPGFSYPQEGQETAPLLSSARAALEAFEDFRAKSVDEGQIWAKWRKEVTPEKRVDWRLLDSLKKLGQLLRGQGFSGETAHALIGKYVYLHYLRDRGFLSKRKMNKWGLDPSTVFGRQAKLTGLRKITEKLHPELNGSVFPLLLSGQNPPPEDCVRTVASVFEGDEPDGQQHLNFEAYSFDHIPIETLSVVYEQFLHAEGKGREKGAYYTPVHLVNFILDEMDAKKPLHKGMKVLDPACGSGAFLVQCYRRLIERELAAAKENKLRPVELRDLLTEHFFGVEKDGDACSVTALSLILTLLDYVEPPDLEDAGNFELPDLRDKNIHQGDFFDADPPWASVKYDWIVGNPPWKPAGKKEDAQVLAWMNANKKDCPVGGDQLAEAFAWKVGKHAAVGGQIGLLLPAMSLFKQKSKDFRRLFFERMDVSCVANFAHLVQVLFKGRSGVPTAAMLYAPHTEAPQDDERNSIITYAPFLVNQEANRSNTTHKQQATWSVIVNESEVRELPWAEAASGESLPWKLAMWGTVRDKRLLERLKRRFPPLKVFAPKHELVVRQGLELRDAKGRPMGLSEEKRDKHKGAPVDPVREVIDENILNIGALRRRGGIYAFPASSLKKVEAEYGFVRKRAGKAGLAVCRPPHIVVDESRRFAVYSDDFIVVPNPNVGVAGPNERSTLLKALSIVLSSRIARYVQFFVSRQWGIQKSVVTKEVLDAVPVPLDKLTAADLEYWAELQSQLSGASRRSREPLLAKANEGRSLASLEEELNQCVYDALDLDDTERWLVDDFVAVQLSLTRGKVRDCAVRPATAAEMADYGLVLADELDGFMDEETKRRYFVRVVQGGNYAVVEINFRLPTDRRPRVDVGQAGRQDDAELRPIRDLLRERHQSQWLYFDRGLRIYDGPKTYLFKPLQRLHWLRSQALADSDEVLADLVWAARGQS
ncbi:MAG: N-6 DNA methylase [Planctomycetota bacterium]